MTKGPPTWPASTSSSGRAAMRSLREDLCVVLRVVAQCPARLEVPPATVIGRDAVQDREAGIRCGQSGLDHPDRVVVGEPGRQPARRLRLGEEAADPGGEGIDAVAVGVQAQECFGGDLGDAVERVWPGAYVDAQQVAAGVRPTAWLLLA